MRRMCVAALLAASFIVGCGQRALDFTVAFRDAQGLHSGNPLVYNGIEIGRVTAVDLQEAGTVAVHVRVEGQYRQHVQDGCRFEVGLPGKGGFTQPALVMTAGQRAGASLAPGAVVRGEDPPDWTRNASESGRKLVDLLVNLKNSKEAQQLGERMRTLGDSLVAKGRRIDASDIEAMKQRMEDLARRLERAGQSEQAKEIRRRLAEWLTSVGAQLKAGSGAAGPDSGGR